MGDESAHEDAKRAACCELCVLLLILEQPYPAYPGAAISCLSCLFCLSWSCLILRILLILELPSDCGAAVCAPTKGTWAPGHTRGLAAGWGPDAMRRRSWELFYKAAAGQAAPQVQ
jgi:hypothetical protein